MNCLLAILMLTERRNHPNGRLVVMQLGEQAELYHTYRHKEISRFRSVEGHSDIFMAPSSIEHAGTHLTIYCSASRSVNSLEKFIIEDTQQLNRLSAMGFHQDLTKEEDCLYALKKRHKELQKIRGLSPNFRLNAFPFIEDRKCTESSVYCLALQGEISLFAKDDLNIKHQGKMTIPVEYNNRFSMASIVLGGKFLHVMQIHQQEFGLAWYQGKLEIFVKVPSSNLWRLKKEDGRFSHHHLINGIIAHQFPGVGAITKALKSLNHKSMGPASHDQYPAQVQEFNQLLSKIGKSGTEFNQVLATGFFIPEPYTHP
ncbi:BgTH12-01062 [Blumeria graminis f. sp. triticale]|uniref:BgtE-20011 n=3 Tax=Blumeria graminis TaxID=34373 RepID=A0A381LDI3_BLUGR|nr:BgTH12-01062 [Blumeria graminis f. sp. triticale]VDB93706.1 BgtE-20011 [Blumeria graminis f. sp. tritici]